MNDILTWILNTVSNVDPILRIVLAGVGILLETSILIGLVIPGDTVVLLAATGIENWTQYFSLLFAVIAGALAGESIGFGLGRYFGPRIRTSALGRRLGERNWVRAETYLDRRGGVAVFISRFLPVLHALIPVTVGMSAMRYRKFLAWTTPACVLWALAYTSVGWLAAGTFRQLSSQLHFAGYLFAAIVLVLGILVVLAKKMIERAEARHMQHAAVTTAAVHTNEDPGT